MPYEFTVIDSRLHLSQRKQNAALARLNKAISHNPWIQGQADLFLFEYRKHNGNVPLSFGAMVDLWGWIPTFEQGTGDLIGLTSYRTETEDELIEQKFLDLLAPDLDDESVVEVEIDHQRRRYLSFRGKIYRLDATYVYPSLDSVMNTERKWCPMLFARAANWIKSGTSMWSSGRFLERLSRWFYKTLLNELEGKEMLRQIFTSDSASIRAFIEEYSRGAGPKVVARLTPGAKVVEICDARGRGPDLEVQTQDKQWHQPFICYKEVADGQC